MARIGSSTQAALVALTLVLQAALVALALAFASSTSPAKVAARSPDGKCAEGQVFWEPGEGCVTLPVLKKRVEPDLVSTDPGAGSEFLVRALVNASGQVEKADVLAVLPEDAVIDAKTTRAVIDAVRQWEFVPGKDTRGVPADMYLTLKIRLLFDE